jgi:hypothetical protein
MIAHEILLSDSALAGLARRFAADPSAVVTMVAGLASFDDRRRWLTHGGEVSSDPHDPRLTVIAFDRTADLTRRLRVASDRGAGWGPQVRLALGVGEARGSCAGLVESDGEVFALDRLGVIGPGMPSVPAPEMSQGHGPWPLAEVLSRTIGALGSEAYTRLRSLHIAIIGCGRSGSLMAESLASLGVARLTLVDPDRVEPHNLGEMASVGVESVGRTKVRAVAGVAGRAAAVGGVVVPVAEPVQSLGSLYAVKPADVLVCCPDAPAARLGAVVLAATYLKPLLDLGTAVLPGSDGPRIGLDVRLTLPGRCLVCLGGLTRVAEARDVLLTGRQEPRAGDFRAERLGSLRSLNTLAVGLGLTLLEGLATGRLSGPAWLQLDLDAQGMPRLSRPAFGPPRECPVCALTARGDAGLRDLPTVLRRIEG